MTKRDKKNVGIAVLINILIIIIVYFFVSKEDMAIWVFLLIITSFCSALVCISEE